MDFDDRVELWWADATTGAARQVKGLRVNDVLGNPIEWQSNSASMLVRTVPENAGPPPSAPEVPESPNIDETEGRASRTWTYQDLLRSKHDEDLFEHFATVQLQRVDINAGTFRPLGAPGMISSVSASPDGNYILVEKLKRPFSYRVPYYSFNRTVEVVRIDGTSIRVVADLPTQDNVPTQGVPTGPRSIDWQAGFGARLVWVEALDGGDPTNKVPHRDQVYVLDEPFGGASKQIMKIQHRFGGFVWTGKRNEAIVTERDRDRRWVTSSLVSFDAPEKERSVLFDLSWNDAYKNPGSPVLQTLPSGERVVVRDGDWIYLSGAGATPEGDRPFLDRFNLRSKKSERLFHSAADRYERFIAFTGTSRGSIVIVSESKTEPPNYAVHELASKKRSPLTTFKDPAPHLTGMSKKLLKYSRKDGVPLSGTLYLPADYTHGQRLPCLIWAYPLEYSDAATAGQVRASPNAFTFFRGTSPLFFVTQGYAVLMDATMPIVGDPESMNETFVEQIVSASQAAIDTLNTMGVIDPSRVMVAGHSYGAFMTANLLAHSDIFAAGIARSGAYNRSLTPFGFQSERRSFWEATDTYMKVSPFTHANRINEPILLIHGEADNNTGTFPIQSERLFQAIRANGGTSRLVMLPHESHGYAARESVLHTLAEMLEWGEKYVKKAKERSIHAAEAQSAA
jgi:dipeptidyl aminopeptidase/acylaminoacyl peptidase